MQPTTGAEGVQWDLSDLYQGPHDPAIDRDRDLAVTRCEEFSERYRGRVAQLDAEGLRDALGSYERILQILHRLGSFSHLLWSTDTADSEAGALLQRMRELGADASQKLVFFDVEWLAIPEGDAGRLIDSEVLLPYRHHLNVSRLQRNHVLSEQAEQVMSATSVTRRSAWVRYFDETLGAARFSLDGAELTEQEVLSRLHSADRKTRRKAHASFTEGLTAHGRTLTYVFNTVLADKSVSDRLRRQPSWIHSRNLANQIDQESVDALVSSVTRAYPMARRYYHLKRRLLGLDEMYDYDRYAPLAESGTSVPWGHARERVTEAYEAFHPRLGEIVTEFFDKRWIDAAMRPGKRGGAYAASVSCDTHPYVFMNYDGRLRDVQTLAHELGHGVHQYLSRGQGELQSGTPLTTAETASVFGEMLVFQRLIDGLEDPSERLALLLGKVDDTIATVFRQISMNRFEERIHTHRREHGELTSREFGEHWMATQEDFYGDSVTLTPEYAHWWSYIPHFLHTPGYVYAYAFGELLVLALYKRYREAPDGFSDTYLAMLSAGGSRWPHELVAEFGLDVRDPGFWDKGLEEFEQLVRLTENTAKEAGRL